MRSGWDRKHPEELAQYKEFKRMITREIWVTNRCKWKYPVMAANIAHFTQAFLDVPKTSEYCVSMMPKGLESVNII